MEEEQIVVGLWQYSSVKWLFWFANLNFDEDWNSRSLFYTVKSLLDNGCCNEWDVVRLAIKGRREQIRSGFYCPMRYEPRPQDPYPGVSVEDMDEGQLYRCLEVFFDERVRKNAMEVIPEVLVRVNYARRK